jgi:hypothetical protein
VPDVAPAPQLLVLNQPLAADLGLSLDPDDVARWFSGADLPPGADPSRRPMPGISSAAFPRSLATVARIFWARFWPRTAAAWTFS